MVEAHRNTSRAVTTLPALLTASITRTPVARRVAGSWTMLCAIASVRIVTRPVARAAGSVADRLEK